MKELGEPFLSFSVLSAIFKLQNINIAVLVYVTPDDLVEI
jgi:hypothetical protein